MSTTRTQRRIEYGTDLGDVRLHVREVGSATADPVLFLHGIMGHRRDWDVLIHQLGRDRRVLAVDQRGHGRADWARDYRVRTMADDAITLIEKLDLSPVPIVGHSMGGMVALVVAARRPDLVSGIVLIDIVPETLCSEFGAQLPEMLTAMASHRYPTIEAAVDEWREGNPLADPSLLHNYVEHALVADPTGYRWCFDAAGLSAFMEGVSPEELWEAIDAVTCPALLVRGEHSPVTTAGDVAAVARRLPIADVVEISGGGHDLGVEKPHDVADATAAFLERLD